MLRLQKDGLSPLDKDALDALLQQVHKQTHTDTHMNTIICKHTHTHSHTHTRTMEYYSAIKE